VCKPLRGDPQDSTAHSRDIEAALGQELGALTVFDEAIG
jgi:hypothetical protein